ncbi:hypothetical protein Ccrd_002396 [Cynara cardunculus var. scolymus]|uniref:Uncharacterized protein n=1 Tax=Cynara cardunculus var. scolymus TaxID=59895 RepID=A0A118JX64_CYNCS|nr:hypothetical protein Ccrd_002396 [Cynara cardunculus var. scolymus]
MAVHLVLEREWSVVAGEVDAGLGFAGEGDGGGIAGGELGHGSRSSGGEAEVGEGERRRGWGNRWRLVKVKMEFWAFLAEEGDRMFLLEGKVIGVGLQEIMQNNMSRRKKRSSLFDMVADHVRILLGSLRIAKQKISNHNTKSYVQQAPFRGRMGGVRELSPHALSASGHKQNGTYAQAQYHMGCVQH